MTKAWLMRRAVLRPVSVAVTSCISSSVCRLPFIKRFHLAGARQRDGLGGRGMAVFRADDLVWGDIETAAIGQPTGSSASGPTRIGTMRRASAASHRTLE